MATLRQVGITVASVFAAGLLSFPWSLYATGGDDLDAPALTIGESLDFLPGKSLGEIFLETNANPADQDSSDLSHDILKIAEELRTRSAAELVPKVDALLAQARQHYASKGDWCNLLHDVRDVLTGSAKNSNAAADYIRWRVVHKELFLAHPAGEEGTPTPSSSPNEYNLEERAASVSGPLRAHWLYLCGAALYRTGDRVQCRKYFEQVLNEFPNHPRAEIAFFMEARCAFAKSREGVEDQDDLAVSPAGMSPPQKEAGELFQSYLKRYPHGSFVADSLGWLGALSFDAKDYLRALDLYIAQAETRGHPETLKSAIFMCERSLAEVAAKPEGQAAFALIAAHPRIAMGFTYLVVSAVEANNYDGAFDKPAEVKKWRRAILPRIAAEVVRQKESYKSGDWQPRYLALLAQAASAQGNQEQALQLTNLAPAELKKSDDLLLVRAVAFQRAGKVAEAIETYRKLLDRFPKTPITPGVRLRLAFALQDNHQAGEALIEFVRLCPPNEDKTVTATNDAEADTAIENSPYTTAYQFPEDLTGWSLRESAVYPNITGANLTQLQQAIDTLLNFAPVLELATALRGGLDSTNREELNAIIAERYLAQENFAEARKFMTPDRYNLLAEKIASLTSKALVAGPGQPEAMAQLGDAWSAARGQLLQTPLNTLVKMVQPYAVLSATERRANGRSLHLKNVDDELSGRDELRHAARWWLAAARARPGTPLAARTRWQALETLPKIARASEFAEELAREIKGGAVSREIYDKLRAECPASAEATKLAAYWNFPAAVPLADRSYDLSSDDRDAHLMGYPWQDFGAFERPNEYGRGGPAKEFADRIAALPEFARTHAPNEFAREVRALDEAERKSADSIDDAALLNFLDDLRQFSSEPASTREMQTTYCGIRYAILESNGGSGSEPEEGAAKNDDAVRTEIDRALANPKMQPVAAYLEFSRIGLRSRKRTELETDIVDPKGDGAKVTVVSRDYAGMEKMARDFLQKYPKSRKREAALFVIARCVQGLSRPVICEVGIPLPGTSPKDQLFEAVQKSYHAEAFDPKRVLAALDDYDREYPQGRYAEELRNFRGMIAWRTQHWDEALDLTIAQLEDSSHLDLRPEAGVRLANIFAELEQAEYRSDLLAAIRTRPAALRHLQTFLARASASSAHPLRYLQNYLTDQLSLSAVAQK
ncbi:MAG: tetratricopeptide repeat protein [Chthoniobacterales bacterium]|nr:tetratricopeptide repeat protein [Chthoniobacterales bacterium]